MKMKNSYILALVRAGLLNTTEHDVPVADAYKAAKFRRAIGKALRGLNDQERQLAKDAGAILDEKGLVDMTKTKQEDAERFFSLQAELMKDETEVEVIPMPYESFHALAKENRATPVRTPGGAHVTHDTFRETEALLEGVLYELN